MSPDVVMSILRLFSYGVYYLFNLGSTLFYVTPYITVCLDCGPKSLLVPFFCFYLGGGLYVFTRLYKVCVISIGGKDTLVDLIELDMVNFDVILGIDWLHSCYDSLDCRTYKVIVQIP